MPVHLLDGVLPNETGRSRPVTVLRDDVKKIDRHIILLALYLPAAISIGWFHSDACPPIGSGMAQVTASAAVDLNAQHDGGLCLACVFAAGQILLYSPTVAQISIFRQIPIWELVIHLQAFQKPHAARAPPFASLS
jgi:hypothetical protein